MGRNPNSMSFSEAKSPPGPAPYHNDRRFVRYIAVFGEGESLFFGQFVDEHPYFQIDENGALACVDASFQNAYCLDGSYVQPFFPADVLLDAVIACRLLRQKPYSCIISSICF